MNKVDLNCDLGESYGRYTLGLDEQVMPFISSANVACGFHASDPMVMDKTIALCKSHNIGIGAHPGFPDLLGFGRRNMDISQTEARNYVLYQLGALGAFCKANNTAIHHVKPHGALYNMAGKDYNLAKGICQGIYDYDPNIIVLGLSGSLMIEAAKDMGLKVAREVFADRAYEEDGSLVNRTKEGAMITDENLAIDRIIGIVKNQKVTTITGKEIPMVADSICVHGDGEKALAFVQKIRQRLEKTGITICPLNQIIS